MERKSIAPKAKKPELEIVKEEKLDSIDSYLPNYTFSYDGVENQEAKEIIKSLEFFIRDHEYLVRQDYQSKSDLAIKEGFSRAVAIVELFFKSLYLDGQE